MTRLVNSCLLAISIFSAPALTIDTTGISGQSTIGGHSKVFQTFTATSHNVLSSWEFPLAPRENASQLNFSVVPWSGNGPSGDALFSTTLDWNVDGGMHSVRDINLILNDGSRYAVMLDQGFATTRFSIYGHNGYSGGSAYFGENRFNLANHDLVFEASFTMASLPDPATTGMLLALSGSALILLRRKCSASHTQQARI